MLAGISGAYAAGTQKLGPQITADSGLGQPEQDHQTFGVSDTGRITVVTQTSVLKSAENGSMFESCKFEMPLSPVTSYRSVSGDGKTLALIRKNKGAFYCDDLGNNRSPGKAKQLVLPNNAAPQSIVISNDGSTVAVRFDPRRRLDDPKGNSKRMQEEFAEVFAEVFAEGFTEGLIAPIRRRGEPPFRK